ncbi:MAG: type I restriction endonuclease subunit R [bacterium]|nr:type I restriction endonuclease subunit R [bacterium]
MGLIPESVVEEATLGWFSALGYVVIGGAEMAPGSSNWRSSYEDVVLPPILQDFLGRLNPHLERSTLESAFRKVTRPEGTTTVARNREFHRLLVGGVPVEYRADDGSIRGARARVIDFDDPDNNDWMVVNQFTVTENGHIRRPDIVVFLNGLPLGVIELKNPGDQDTTIWTAWQQLQTYKAELPTLFSLNGLLVVSDGLETRIGTLTAGKEWFKPWRTIDGEKPAPSFLNGLQVLIEGVFDKSRFLTLLRDFVVFEDDGSGVLAKKVAGYHQFHAVKAAVEETLRATKPQASPLEAATGQSHDLHRQKPGGRRGDRRIGVVWHTQGSGKSLTMVFYTGAIIRELEMRNPTVVVLTDRNDLDNQLFGVFARCSDLLGQPPVQAESRADLRQKLAVKSGGVVFTTIHKFFSNEKGDRHPSLSERENIVVVADEAHRSQYDFIDGFARHMRDALPRASFVGFTGTPIELKDANTRAVFGDHISIYDITRSVDDEATVPIYYESRLARLELDENERPSIDPQFEEVTESEEIEGKERLKTKWAQLEAIVGTEKRLRLVAADIVDHFEQRLEVLNGKAMVVCMSRRICVDLHRQVGRLRPEWYHEEDEKGIIKVVMTGSASDPLSWQQHIRNKSRREALAKRFRNSDDPLQIVLVRDMWLTGFDAPSLHTMYVDKPMRGHGLMQAIARVNRVFKDKPGGLVVDYLGIAHDLKKALAVYTQSGGTGTTAVDQGEAVAVMLEKHEVCLGLFHGFDWSTWVSGSPAEKLGLLPGAQEHILAQEDGKDRCLAAVRQLTQAFALAVPHEETKRIREDLSFFQTVRAALAKREPSEFKQEEQLEHAVRQIISRAVAPQGVLDIFSAADLKKPDISVLSDEFLAEVQKMPHRNLAVELLQKLLKGEISTRHRKNMVQARSFSEMLEQSLRRYQNRAIEAAQVIEELIELAKEMREANARGEKLGLSEEELAFYDALGTNDSAVKVMGDDVLSMIARELVQTVRNNVTIDWTLRENIRAKLRTMVKRILRKHGYPPDKQEKASRTVLQQAEHLSETWVA